MFENQTEEAIKKRILERLPKHWDTREGSFIFDLIAPMALELTIAYANMDRALQLGFAETTYGVFLDYKASERGLKRKPAVRATGYVLVRGASGTVIPKGSLFVTKSGTQFQTKAEVSIEESGEVIALVEAVEAGNKGNVPSGSIVTIPVSLPGVVAVTNPEPTQGGADLETDEELLARYFEKVRMPATSGNIHHYKMWAKEVPGVGDVKVSPLWNGPGTVKVVIVDANKGPASDQIVQTVFNHIEEVRPIGVIVTVTSARAKAINVMAEVSLATGHTIQEVQQKYIEGLSKHFRDIAFNETYVSYARIGSLLLNTPGVLDYTNLLVNNGVSNIALEDDEIPVLGAVELGV